MLYEREEPINTLELRRLIIANLPDDDYLAAKPTGAKDPHPFQLWSVEAIRGLVLNVSAASLSTTCQMSRFGPSESQICCGIIAPLKYRYGWQVIFRI